MIPQVPDDKDKVPRPPARDAGPVFTVGADHWFGGVRRAVFEGGAIMPVRRALVIHFTNGRNATSTIASWRHEGTGVCAHLVIDRDGSVTQCRPFNRTCGHAGVSRWVDPRKGVRYTNLNSCTIGIELCNAGAERSVLAWARQQPGFAGTLTARHRNGGREQEWEKFPLVQVQACVAAAQALVKRYHLDDITGHDCIAPERRDDPGPAFPMQVLRAACGFSGLPEVFSK